MKIYYFPRYLIFIYYILHNLNEVTARRESLDDPNHYESIDQTKHSRSLQKNYKEDFVTESLTPIESTTGNNDLRTTSIRNSINENDSEEKAALEILQKSKIKIELEDDELDNVATVPANLIKEKIYWIDATYKALDAGINISMVKECESWQLYWKMEGNITQNQFMFITASNDTIDEEEDSSEENIKTKTVKLIEYEIIESKSRLEELQLSTELFEVYEAVGILFKEICGNHERQLFFKTPEDSRRIGINKNSSICDPFKIELQPNTETLTKLSIDLNQFIEKSSKNFTSAVLDNANEKADTSQIVILSESANKPPKVDIDDEKDKELNDDQKQLLRFKRKINEMHEKRIGKNLSKKQSETSSEEGTDKSKDSTKTTTETPSAELNEDDADWLELLSFSKHVLENLVDNETLILEKAWLQIDATDETNPVMYILYPETADALGLTIPRHSFKRYEKVGLYLPGVCADFIPTAIDAFNASDFEGIEIEGPIGVNITALELAGVNLTELAEKLRNDTEVDEILTRTNGSTRALGGSYILPVLNKNQYDPFSAPIVFQGSAVVVRFGIYIESMSNFQTSTMDYDMDVYLLLAWRDARLVNPYDKPILVKEEEILEKIWRPDPFFDAKEAEFHEVTFLNFLMRIYNDGLVLYETRIKLKPACNLVLCKYPHDKQTCELQIKSFAYPIETVRFEWFTRKIDAIDKNPDVKLPELYIDRYEPTFCNRSRKSGDFSCLRAVFRLKRDVGFHIAQTYIPTSLALMFSWVGVWLPEEFMEGRIGVAITVLLTLSTESAGAREHLPSVSYLKAIDLWFGYITGFVFFTLLQTLFVIGFDKRANQLRKWANRKRLDLTQEARDALIMKANRYHKTGRYLDNFCRVFYPLSFLLFLIMYYFVFTEGRQDDCISER